MAVILNWPQSLFQKNVYKTKYYTLHFKKLHRCLQFPTEMECDILSPLPHFFCGGDTMPICAYKSQVSLALCPP